MSEIKEKEKSTSKEGLKEEEIELKEEVNKSLSNKESDLNENNGDIQLPSHKPKTLSSLRLKKISKIN
jgi:hypothetical protein